MLKNKVFTLCFRTIIKLSISIVFVILSISCRGSGGSGGDDPVISMPYELITPEHIITNTNTTVSLQCDPKFAGSNIADVYVWRLIKPDGSEASLTSNNADATVSIGGTEGFYIIEISIYKNSVCIGINYAYVGTTSVVHYIRAGAAGSNSGADWTNAWTELPATLVRGHTYYIADGFYPSYYCATAQDGVTPIYIKKAIPSDHGTDTGWNSGTMGSNQATFTNASIPLYPPFALNSNYVVIDGQIGKENGSDGGLEKHGFLFYSVGDPSRYGFLVGNRDGLVAAVSNIKLKHSEIISLGNTARGFQVNSTGSCKNLLLHGCYIHDALNVSIYFNATSYSIVEYCYVARNHSDAVNHGEGLQTSPDLFCTNNIIRYNIWEDIEGTAVIVGSSNWEIYGNIFFWTQAYIDDDPVGRHVAGQTCTNGPAMGVFDGDRNHVPPAENCKFFNNTIVAGYPAGPLNFALNMGVFFTEPNNYIYNNLWVSCDKLPSMVGVHDYNMYYNNNLFNTAYIINETHKQDVLINPLNPDYSLIVETDPGKELEGAYSYDMYGNKRGFNGTWSRGALQFQ